MKNWGQKNEETDRDTWCSEIWIIYTVYYAKKIATFVENI